MSNNKRKYKLDESVWDKLTPESAYWIGFLYGDGNCTQENKVRLQIAWSDKEHLYAFRNFIGSIDRPVKEIFMQQKWHNASIEFRSWKVHNTIKKYGLTKRKCDRGRIPVCLLQKEVARDFIRGLFDADGSFYYDGIHRNYLFSEITGYMPTLVDVKAVLVSEGVISEKKHIVKNGSVFRLRLAKSDTVKLIRYLYGNKPTYKLKRKYGMAKNYLDRLNEVTDKSEATVETKYHRPLESFNQGKVGEANERQYFSESCCCGK